MPSLADFTTHGSIGVITVNNPPVNAVSPGVPEGIEAALAEGNGDAAVAAMVLIVGGRHGHGPEPRRAAGGGDPSGAPRHLNRARPRNLFCACVILALAAPGWAAEPEYVLSEETAPDAAVQRSSTLADPLRDERRPSSRFPRVKQRMSNLPPFLRDTTVILKPRNYYFDQGRNPKSDRVAWAIGGALSYRSGWWRDRVAIGATFYTSQKIYGPKDRGGTNLLRPVQTGFGVIGEANVRVRLFPDVEFRGYRQLFGLPYLNANDGRMVPNAHEGYIVAGKGPSSVDFIAGHVTKMKLRRSNEFEYMSEAAGFPGTDDGVTMGGGRYAFNDETDVGVIDFFSWNFMNTLYAEANVGRNLTKAVRIRFRGQFTNQRSVGDEYGGNFDTNTFGGALTLSYQGFALTVAATSTDEERGISKPYGGSPSVIALMQSKFDRAGEDAWRVGLDYDFRHFEIDGLSAFASYAEGNTPDSGPRASSDQTEWDITVDYRPAFTRLNGLWLRLRQAQLDRSDPNAVDRTDWRFILNYTVPIL